MNVAKINTYIHQKVNSYLCLALISLMTVWTGLYYGTHKAEAIAANISMTSAQQGAFLHDGTSSTSSSSGTRAKNKFR
jgi:hypothetical protein